MVREIEITRYSRAVARARGKPTESIPSPQMGVEAFNSIGYAIQNRFQFYHNLLTGEGVDCQLTGSYSHNQQSNRQANTINFKWGKFNPTTAEKTTLDLFFIKPDIPDESIPEEVIVKSFREVSLTFWGNKITVRMQRGDRKKEAVLFSIQMRKLFDDQDNVDPAQVMNFVDDLVLIETVPNSEDIKIKGRDYWVRKEGKVVPDTLVYKLRNVFRFFTP